MSPITNKTTRLEIRVTTDERETVEYAATLEGTTVSAYMRSRILKAAREDIHAQEKIRLSNQDRDRFLNALENPADSQGSLKSAFSEFRDKYQKS
ncbi:MAG: DUF1778 domain-containing protein [Thermosynechococcaceae cyanobacterium]